MKAQIETFLKNASWKQRDTGLMIPAQYDEKPRLDLLEVSGAVFLTYSELMDSNYTEKNLKNDLAQLSVEDCLATVSKILTVLHNEGRSSSATQSKLVQSCLAGEIRKRTLAFLRQEPERLVFFEAQLLLIAKYAVLWAKSEAANDFGQGVNLPIFSRIILGMSDLLLEGSETYEEPDLQSFIIKSMYFNSRQNLFNDLGRNEDMFIQIPKDLSEHHQYLDIPRLFREATGLSIEDYLLLGFSLFIQLVQQRVDNFKPESAFIDPETYLSKSVVPKEEIAYLFKQYTTNTTVLQGIFSEQDKFEFNFNGLVQHPLVTFDGKRFFPLYLGFLEDKVTLQLYWILFDYIKGKYGEERRKRYTNFMGACFEDYVCKSLERIYPSSSMVAKRLVTEIEYNIGKTTFKTVDSILINAASLILFEAKISQLKVYLTGILGDLEAFREDMQKIVVEAFIQIQRTKEHFQKGLLTREIPVNPSSIKSYYPVIVVYGKFVMFPMVWKILEEEIRKECTSIDEEVMQNLQIIQIDELELVQELIEKSGLSFEDLLRKKISDPVYKQLPFFNFFYYEFPQFRPLKNPYLGQKFQDFSQRLRLKLFGQQVFDTGMGEG